MKIVSVFLLFAVFAAIGLSTPRTWAKEKKEKAAAGEQGLRWHGTVVRSSKDASTLTVRRRGVERIVHYDSSTVWTKDNKPSDASAVKDGDRVIALGKYNDKKEYWATRIEIRPPHTMP